MTASVVAEVAPLAEAAPLLPDEAPATTRPVRRTAVIATVTTTETPVATATALAAQTPG